FMPENSKAAFWKCGDIECPNGYPMIPAFLNIN
ncbi:uncharacterized protein METZ01_LOCUS289910, partial [marine metagenome]